MKALILVDIQNDFLPGGALAVPEGDRVVPIANALQPHYDLVVASKDWHPANHASFAANHPEREVGDRIDLHGLPQVLWPVHCVQDTPGAQFTPGLETAHIQKVFTKGVDPEIDSYSALYDNGHRRSTGLEEYLREQGAEEVHLCGLATDYCVKFTGLDALNSGFRVAVIQDACRGVNLQSGDSERALEELTQTGAQLLHSSDILKAATVTAPGSP